MISGFLTTELHSCQLTTLVSLWNYNCQRDADLDAVLRQTTSLNARLCETSFHSQSQWTKVDTQNA